MSKESNLCQGIFSKSVVVNYYFRGLKYSLRNLLIQRVLLMPRNERNFVKYVHQADVAAGRTQRALVDEKKDTLFKVAKASSLVTKTHRPEKVMMETHPP